LRVLTPGTLKRLARRQPAFGQVVNSIIIMRQPVLQLLLLCTALTACAAETVTVPGNSCVVPKYMITNTPTTYALNLSSLAGSPSGICSAESLLCGAVALPTPPLCWTGLRQRAESRGLASPFADTCSLRCDHTHAVSRYPLQVMQCDAHISTPGTMRGDGIPVCLQC